VLERFLRPLESVFNELQDEIEGPPTTAGTTGNGLLDLLEVDRTPPDTLSTLHVEAADEFVMACLTFLGGWLGIPVRPPPARTVAWNRDFIRRAIQLLPLHGTLPGIDQILRAWLSGDIVDDQQAGGPVLVVTDLRSPLNLGPSAFCLGLTSTLGVDTVVGEGPPSYLIVDVMTLPEVRLLRHPVGVDGLRRSALFILEDERPLHVHGELRIRGRTMRLAPPGDPKTWDTPEVYAQLEEPSPKEPYGTALLWDEPLVVPFPDDTAWRT
jgi:hypothetical protein